MNPIVEHALESLLAVSANSIRAGIVDKPEDYRWCGYAAALAGKRKAQQGIAQIYAYRGRQKPTWNQIRGEYRQALFEKGLEMLEDPESGVRKRLGFTAEEVEEEIRTGKTVRGPGTVG